MSDIPLNPTRDLIGYREELPTVTWPGEARIAVNFGINYEEAGEPPLGYYAGMPSINTRRLVVEAGTFLYDSDVYNDDLPYWSPDYPGPLLIPYSLDTNDSRFGRGERCYQVGGEFFTYLKDSFDQLYHEGETRPKMMTVGLHARLIGRPGRIGALHGILDYMLGHDRVWICRRGDIARHWAETHPNGNAAAPGD